MDLLKMVTMMILMLGCFVTGMLVGQNSDQHSGSPVTKWPSQYSLMMGRAYQVNRVKVIQGHIFDVYLENHKRYLIALDGVFGTPVEAKDAVTRHLNASRENGQSLVVVPRSWSDSERYWLADVYLDSSQSESLFQFLEKNQLLFNR